MKTATVGEVQKNFSQILQTIHAGDEITITRHGKPVALLKALGPSRDIRWPDFYGHEHIGIYFRPTVEWPSVFHTAMTPAKMHTAGSGCRSLDILHVATALTMGATRFITFDHRQSTLASHEGLDVRFFSAISPEDARDASHPATQASPRPNR